MDEYMVGDSDDSARDARHSQSGSTVSLEGPNCGTTSSESTDGRRSVLVVDDEPAITDAYATWLDDEYDVRTAYSGAEALAQLDASVDAMLLDRRMPERSGEDVLAEMRDRGLDCRVAIISAEGPDDVVRDLGYDAYLQKPVTERDRILGVVEDLLDVSR